MTNKKVYPWKTRLGTDFTGDTLRRRDGHEIRRKVVNATCTHAECQRPDKKFECVITTKPPFYCPECQIVVTQARRKRDQEKYQARRKKADADRGTEPRRRLIRYAGYDKGEKHDD